MWKWLKPREVVETRTRDDLAGGAIIRVMETTRRIDRGAVPKLPEFVVAVDVETTGLHSHDRIVSLGAIWLPTAPLAEGSFNVSYIHLIFDPGRKSHPKAEEVHGYDDWVLRHQEPFEKYADYIRKFIYAGEVVIAHNADFDLSFINREMENAGKAARINRPIYCTMQGYRASGRGGSAGLASVCADIGLARAGHRHGALEDAWMSLMVYLWLNGYEHCKPFTACGQHLELFNLLPVPPRPEGALPRRHRKRAAGT